MSKGAMLTLLGALAGLVSVFLPWANLEILGVAVAFKPWGESLGWVLLVFAVLVFVLAMQGDKKGSKGMKIGALVLAVLFVGLVAVNDPARSGFDVAEKLYGFYVGFVAALVMLVGSIMLLVGKKK